MKKYYVRLNGSEIIERAVYDTTEAPSGLTEITKAQFDGIHDVTRVYEYSGGSISTTGDRTITWDSETPEPGPERPDAYIDP